MKHTKNYMDAKWVIQNPEKYDNRDVVRANSFIKAYNEGYNKALSLGTTVRQSEQCSSCEESTGETKLWCCNHCGKRIEDF